MKANKKAKDKVVSTKPLPAVGSEIEQSAKIGGVGNTPKNATKDYTRGK